MRGHVAVLRQGEDVFAVRGRLRVTADGNPFLRVALEQADCCGHQFTSRLAQGQPLRQGMTTVEPRRTPRGAAVVVMVVRARARVCARACE